MIHYIIDVVKINVMKKRKQVEKIEKIKLK